MAQTTSDIPGSNGAGNTEPPAQTPNTVQPGRARTATAEADEKPNPRTLFEFAPDAPIPAENSIKPSAAKVRAHRTERTERIEREGEADKATAPPTAERKPITELDTHTVPEEVRQRFVQRRRKFYLPDGTHMFTDRGKRLTAPSENTEVIATLIQIAKARGWNQITVTGTERFRKEAWMAAELVGLKVRGYQPSAEEQALLIRRIARQRAEEANPTSAVSDPKPPLENDRNLWIGKLSDHDAAPYRHDPKQSMSYYVRLETTAGETELWGIDFQRALKEASSRPRIGDEVTLRSLGQQPVTVSVPTRDAEGRVIGEQKLKTYRNRWLVEKTSFLHERAAVANLIRDPEVAPARAAKTHPSLAGTYLAIHAAELASKQFRDPNDRARFIQIIRNSLADSIERGEPLQAVRLREKDPAPRHREPPRTPERAPSQARSL